VTFSRAVIFFCDAVAVAAAVMTHLTLKPPRFLFAESLEALVSNLEKKEAHHKSIGGVGRAAQAYTLDPEAGLALSEKLTANKSAPELFESLIVTPRVHFPVLRTGSISSLIKLCDGKGIAQETSKIKRSAKHPSYTIGVMVQPTMLQELFTGIVRVSGFIHRFLFFFMPTRREEIESRERYDYQPTAPPIVVMTDGGVRETWVQSYHQIDADGDAFNSSANDLCRELCSREKTGV